MTSWPRRVADSGWLWRGPGLLAAAILALTSVVALMNQQEANRRRELVFATQADQLRQGILQAIDREGERFRAAVDFVAVTHPSPADQFRSFFDLQAAGLDGDRMRSSFNFILIEAAERSSFAELEERERSLGNAGFRVRALPGAASSRLVITRTARDPVGIERDVRGLDVTIFAEQAVVPVPGEGYALRVLEEGPVLSFLLAFAGQPEVGVDEEVENLSTLVLLVSPVPGPDGRVDEEGRLALAVRVVSIADLLSPVDRRQAAGLRASLVADGSDRPVAVLTGPRGGPQGPTELAVEYDLTTDGQRWELVIEADDDYGLPSSGLSIWAFGLTVAALSALALMARNWHGRRLVETELELASALTVASTDGLTGLLNRVGFVQRSAGRRPGEAASVLFIDLDGFKTINDLDGHEAGDRVLQRVAEKLCESTRAVDLVSRLGGDEFIVYLVETADPEGAAQLASRLIDAVDDVDHRLSCSIGVALRPPGSDMSVDELLRRADAAMYVVKRSGGRGYHLAGADAGPMDKAGADAGPMDKAGADAGPMDKAGADAGPMDKAGADAGPMDKAGADAGPIDKAGADAGYDDGDRKGRADWREQVDRAENRR